MSKRRACTLIGPSDAAVLAALACGFFEAWLRCPMGGTIKRPLTVRTTRGLMHHWRTVGPDIPRQVASQQSLIPFLRAISH